MASFKYLWVKRAKFPITSVQFYRAWAKRLLSLPELISRNSRRSKLTGKGAKIHHLAEIGHVKVEGDASFLSVGESSFLGKVYIALHDNVEIGDKVCINDGVQLLTGSHDVSDPMWSHVKAKIVIDNYAWIGTNAMILPGVHIGRGAVVGAGAVVAKSVKEGAIVVGNPAKPISKTRSELLLYDPCEFLAANRSWLIG